ncbi:MAG: lytic transglycosylase [Legionellales bacterium]|nr:lytic transglycosylase [Legionellales bacterium]
MIEYMQRLLVCGISLIALTACSSTTPTSNHQHTSENQQRSWLDKTLHPDLWQAINRTETISYNPKQTDIVKQIAFYTKNKHTIPTLANNAQPYLYYIYQQTQVREMPAELALLPMVESNYNPFLYSNQGATGLWQIMPGTASGFHLDINWWYDGRRDIRASTKAALDYLTYLHDFFDDWLLAIAAYNCGEGTVNKAIHHNQQAHLPTDFWSLSLPYQTKIYVPKLLALATIIKNPEQYNTQLPSIANTPYFTSVSVSGQIDFSLIAKLANVSTQTVRALNPGYRRFATAPTSHDSLLLPIEKAPIFTDNLNHHTDKKVHWEHHRVQSGDTLSTIAKHYHTRVSVLERVNNLHSSIIHPNQDLLVPLTKELSSTTPQHTRQIGNIAEDHVPGPQKVTYTVQAHDTLETIAQRYHVTLSAICFWNHLSKTQPLHIHQTLILWLSPRSIHSPSAVIYTVKSGDTLSTIAQRYHSTTAQLKTINHLPNNLIRIGQKLTITPGSGKRHAFQPKHSHEMIIHTVHQGESISTIAHHYHVSTHQIASWNHLKHPSMIHIGQKLQIYPKKTT